MTPGLAGHGTEVAVVGGGIMGASLAWHLARRGVRVTLLERATLAPGGGGRAAAAAAWWRRRPCPAPGRGPRVPLRGRPPVASGGGGGPGALLRRHYTNVPE